MNFYEYSRIHGTKLNKNVYYDKNESFDNKESYAYVDKKRKIYGKFFALTIFVPFISFITILFASQNKYTMYLGIAIFFYLAIKSCPLLFKNILFSKFEKIFFWFIWILSNSLLFSMIISVLRRGFVEA